MATNGHSPDGGAHRVDFTPLKPVQRTQAEVDALEGMVWFDIDNCLYSKSRGIAPLMSQKIHEYFMRMGLNEAEAWETHLHYYKNYGLAIRGLQQHFPEFDAEDFDRNCDGALPLEDLLSEDKPLQDLLKGFDRSKVKVMALTNAYKPHALRVLGILGVTDLFEGVISCQYPVLGFPAKPDKAYYEQAMLISSFSEPSQHYFIDDSFLNVKGAKVVGWNAWLFDEDGTAQLEKTNTDGSLSTLQDLRQVWGKFMKISP